MNATETARGPAVRATQLTTLAEQLFDHEQDTPSSLESSRPAPGPARHRSDQPRYRPVTAGAQLSAGSLRYLEGLTHRVPHGLGLDSLGQSLVHGPAAQLAQ